MTWKVILSTKRAPAPTPPATSAPASCQPSNAEFFKIPTGTREAAALDGFIDYMKENRELLDRPEDDQALFRFPRPDAEDRLGR